MRDGMTLWRERISSYWNEAIRYLRLIGNSGFLFTVYFLILIGSFYYSQALEELPEAFPSLWVFTVIFAIVLTRGRIRTFVKQADVVFLLPYESKLDRYFRASQIYSYILQSFVMLVIFIVLAPLFALRISNESGSFWFVLLMLLIAKAWNVASTWQEQRFASGQERGSHFLLRLMVNGVFTYLLFSGADFIYLIAVVGIMALLYVFYYQKLAVKLSIKWEHLISIEQKMLMFFYRIANAFTDVPQLKEQVRSRSYLNGMLGFLSANKKSVYHYLFARTFIRANDYLGVYVRLVVVASFLLAILPNGWMEIAVFLLFMHMVMMQLSTLWFHYDTNMWVDLYPIEQGDRKEALTTISFRLLLVITAVLTGVLLVSSTYLITAIGLAIGILFSYLGSTTWIHKRKKQAW
ncbi:ABC transporter permease [Alkalihalophilus pseudofirmus]|uniref:ABC transporter permease n=3 Tax=Alkalihalophilus TaxID=2893060 RepID=A0AAJ2U260_ALKPS|nr:ABC transporter permease [Alkalihalophilus pseudofirmus]MDV2886904.1 ABC transporter permease [Alkalihalophilus pseudofirmus]